jgi:MtN3 and saliva related transmembrane protein
MWYYTDIIGYTAGLLMATTMLPQIVKSLRTKSVKDLSPLMLVLYSVSALLWSSYGFLINSLPVLITDGFAFCVVSLQLIIKIKYSEGGNYGKLRI